jgi:hypothetical protein
MSNSTTTPKTRAAKEKAKNGPTNTAGGKKTGPSTSAAKTRRVVDLDTARAELETRGLDKRGRDRTLDELVDFLVNFEKKEEEEVEDLEDLVRAIGYLLRHEMVSMAAFATADTVAASVRGLIEVERKSLTQSLDEEKARLAKQKEELAEGEERILEERRRLDEEWLALRGKERELTGEGSGVRVEHVIKLLGDKVNESLGRLDAGLKALEDSRSRLESQFAAPQQGMVASPIVSGSRRTGRPTLAEVAAAGVTGSLGASPEDRRDRQDEEERKKWENTLRKGEEKRDRQIMLDAGDVDGQKSLKGHREKLPT